MMDVKSRAYCKTHHVCRMWNFNLEITTGLPKMVSGLQKCVSVSQKCIPVCQNCDLVSQKCDTVSQKCIPVFPLPRKIYPGF